VPSSASSSAPTSCAGSSDMLSTTMTPGRCCFAACRASSRPAPAEMMVSRESVLTGSTSQSDSPGEWPLDRSSRRTRTLTVSGLFELTGAAPFLAAEERTYLLLNRGGNPETVAIDQAVCRHGIGSSDLLVFTRTEHEVD